MEYVLNVELLFNFIDIAGFHVSLRNKMCATDVVLNRLQVFVSFNCIFVLFYFSCTDSAYVLGIYLFVSLNYFGKFDEGFSSLRLETYKNFIRFHLDKNGDLTCYVIGIDNVPTRWKLDKRWSGNKLEDNNDDEMKDEPSYLWQYPSKWRAYYSSGGRYNMNKKYVTYKNFKKYIKILDKFVITHD